MKHLATAAVVGTLTLSACAQAPSSISSQYISPHMYSGLSCNQLRGEAYRISSRVSQLTGQQQKEATEDAIATGVALVLFWPAIFLLADGGDNASELGRLKGELDAVNYQYVAKNCAGGAPAVQYSTPVEQKDTNAPSKQDLRECQTNADAKCQEWKKQGYHFK